MHFCPTVQSSSARTPCRHYDNIGHNAEFECCIENRDLRKQLQRIGMKRLK